MKKCFFASLLTLAASCFAADPMIESLPPANLPGEPKLHLRATPTPASGFIYVRMNVADPQIAQTPQLRADSFVPGLGMGYRRGSNKEAIDLSIGFNSKTSSAVNEMDEKVKEKETYWTFPKMTYLRYFSPKKDSSFYGGIGLSWGGLITEKAEGDTLFFGIIPTACFGYEANRKDASWRSFFQLEVSQPALALTRKGDSPKPLAELSVGLGY